MHPVRRRGNPSARRRRDGRLDQPGVQQIAQACQAGIVVPAADAERGNLGTVAGGECQRRGFCVELNMLLQSRAPRDPAVRADLQGRAPRGPHAGRQRAGAGGLRQNHAEWSRGIGVEQCSGMLHLRVLRIGCVCLQRVADALEIAHRQSDRMRAGRIPRK
jgi:hypothetical protein